MSKSYLTSGSTVGLQKIRKDTISKWDSLGFLDGLSGHVKPNIAELYECCASHLLNEDNAWYVYMVECSDNSIYTGISNNVSKRILAHNSGKGAKYTRSRLPVTLKWSEACRNRSEASKLEVKIKKLSRKEKLKKIEDS